jgi:predicted DNA-binding transcriptional regulator YafY
VISCNYRSKSRFIQPYRLINHYGLWYLAGVDEDSLKAFELARLEQLAVTDKPFVPIPL